MVPEPVNLAAKLAAVTEQWSPRVIAKMNDYCFKLVKLEGEFIWHHHEDTDETFIVLDGQMCIEFEDYRMDMKAGELFVVPKGIRHRPCAKNECHVLVVEPAGVVNTGTAGGEMTAETDQWI